MGGSQSEHDCAVRLASVQVRCSCSGRRDEICTSCCVAPIKSDKSVSLYRGLSLYCSTLPGVRGPLESGLLQSRFKLDAQRFRPCAESEYSDVEQYEEETDAAESIDDERLHVSSWINDGPTNLSSPAK